MNARDFMYAIYDIFNAEIQPYNSEIIAHINAYARLVVTVREAMPCIDGPECTHVFQVHAWIDELNRFEQVSIPHRVKVEKFNLTKIYGLAHNFAIDYDNARAISAEFDAA